MPPINAGTSKSGAVCPTGSTAIRSPRSSMYLIAVWPGQIAFACFPASPLYCHSERSGPIRLRIVPRSRRTPALLTLPQTRQGVLTFLFAILSLVGQRPTTSTKSHDEWRIPRSRTHVSTLRFVRSAPEARDNKAQDGSWRDAGNFVHGANTYERSAANTIGQWSTTAILPFAAGSKHLSTLLLIPYVA